MQYDTVIKVNGRSLSIDSPTYFIADIAANHDGDLERAKQLIVLAKEAGADCAKFQHFLAKDIVSDYGFKNLKSAGSHQASWKKSVYEIYEDYELPRDWDKEIVNMCIEVGVDFMTTPYDYAAVDLYAPLVSAFKIGSGDITWTGEIEYIAKKNKPVLLATGASAMSEVELAVDSILRHNPKIVLMQCNTNYTGNVDNFNYINLKVLQSYSSRWPGMLIGLSDHTPGHTTVLGAVSFGARIIEKHFTDDTAREGPDHKFSMTPVAWKEMVDRTRELELAFGDGVKRIELNETETVILQRRALRLKTDLAEGTVLAEEHITPLRPCPKDGIPPSRIDEVIGRSLTHDMVAGSHLKWKDLNAPS